MNKCIAKASSIKAEFLKFKIDLSLKIGKGITSESII